MRFIGPIASRLLIVCAVLCTPLAASAQSVEEKSGWSTPPMAPGLPTSMLEVFFNLALVIAAIALLAWGYRRLQGGVAPASGGMKIVAVLPLGQKERVMLLAVGGKHLVVGVSPAGLNTLHVLDDSFDPSEISQTAAGSGFAERLRTVMSGRGGQ